MVRRLVQYHKKIVYGSAISSSSATSTSENADDSWIISSLSFCSRLSPKPKEKFSFSIIKIVKPVSKRHASLIAFNYSVFSTVTSVYIRPMIWEWSFQRVILNKSPFDSIWLAVQCLQLLCVIMQLYPKAYRCPAPNSRSRLTKIMFTKKRVLVVFWREVFQTVRYFDQFQRPKTICLTIFIRQNKETRSISLRKE